MDQLIEMCLEIYNDKTSFKPEYCNELKVILK